MLSFPASLLTAGAGILYKWDDISKFTYRTNYLYGHVDTLKHLIDDHHEVLHLNNRIELFGANYLKTKKEVDSLKMVIKMIEIGKFPYDSIWVKSRSGHFYKTTVKDYLSN